MKKQLFAFCLACLFCGCDEQKVLETVNKLAETAENVNIPSTGIGQLDAAVSDEMAKTFYTNREILVTNSFTNDTIWHFKGRARISEKTSNGDITVHYIEDGVTKKIDFVGSTMNFVSKQF
jgi:hypothetical protein